MKSCWKFSELVVARGGIEPPTRDTPNLSSTHSWHPVVALVVFLGNSDASSLRFQRNDLSVLPDVDRYTVHAGGLARVFCSSAQGAPHLRGKLRFRFSGSLFRHSLVSS